MSRAATGLLMLLLPLAGSCHPAELGEPDHNGLSPLRDEPRMLFADRPWYLEQAAPERQWRGWLRRRAERPGPAARLGLAFELETASGALPVYAAGVEELMSDLVDRPVVLVGKRVDLGDEGFGVELWPGSIRPAAQRP